MNINLAFTIIFVSAALASGGCSYLTKSGRQEAAYARYVRHSSYARVRMQRKLSPMPKIKPVETPPEVTTGSGPESVTAGNESE